MAGTYSEDSSVASFAAWVAPGPGTAATIHCPLTLDRIVHAARQFGLSADELASLTIVASASGHGITAPAGNVRCEAFLAELVERGYGTVPTADPVVAAPATREGSRDALLVAFRPRDRARYARMNREGTIIKTCAACGARYTRQTWAARAYYCTQGDDDDVNALELRHCVCRSTIAIKIGAERCMRELPPAREPTQAERGAVADDAVCEVLDLYGRPTSRSELREMLGPYSSSLPGRRAQHGVTIIVWWSRREVAEALARVLRRGLVRVVGRRYMLTAAGKRAIKKTCRPLR